MSAGEERRVECGTHGRAEAAFVCRHLVGATTGPGLSISKATDGGRNWKPSAVGLPGEEVDLLLCEAAGVVFAVVGEQQLYRSESSDKSEKPLPVSDFVPWAAARFPTEEARDQFLHVVAAQGTSDVEVKPMPDVDLGAWVRWRPGGFLVLNDVAYAHGGRIVFPAAGRRGPMWAGS